MLRIYLKICGSRCLNWFLFWQGGSADQDRPFSQADHRRDEDHSDTDSQLQLSFPWFRQKWFQMQSMAVMQFRPTRKPFQSGKCSLGSREKVLIRLGSWRVTVHRSCFNQVLMDSSCCNYKPEQKCCFSFFLFFICRTVSVMYLYINQALFL